MDYSAYDQILTQQLVVYVIVSGLLLIVGLGCIIYIVKNRSDMKTYEFVLLLVLICGSVIGAVIWGGNSATDIAYDIKNQAYIVSEGAFTVIEDEATPSKRLSLILSDGTRFEIDRYIYNTGEYTGRVVYGEKTRCVLDVQLMDVEDLKP